MHGRNSNTLRANMHEAKLNVADVEVDDLGATKGGVETNAEKSDAHNDERVV